MEQILFLAIGIVIGATMLWLVFRFTLLNKYVNKIELGNIQEKLNASDNEKLLLSENNENLIKEVESQKEEIKSLREQKEDISNKLSAAETKLDTMNSSFEENKKELKKKTEESAELTKNNIALKENNNYLNEKLENQKKELEEIGKKFTNEFKVLADQILETKSKKFTALNKEQLNIILEPLGKNIQDFKKQVEETHKKDIEDRATIQERIKSIVESSQQIKEEANNLAKALKGSVKKQGDWGEMILENILEASGLSKGREYFVQEFLKDETGQFIKDENGKKLQPDVVLKYPDNRKVIVDSKVSLIAYEKFCSSEEIEEQNQALEDHFLSIKTHIDNLSKKNYQNFAPTLDFVMLFIPIEPAYLLAMQKDSNLWNYAYKKRILLISPTNLIAALKLVADLWQREDQNRNAKEIAERGGKLYDKFVNFLTSLTNVGTHMERTQKSYDDALKQLKTGSGNLVGQAQKLKELKVDAKKEIPQTIIDETDLSEE